MGQIKNPAGRLYDVLRQERSDIYAVYFFAFLGGIIQLSLPVGIQAIIGYVLGGVLSASIILLITVLVLAVFFNGTVQVAQMKVIERIQQRIFVKYAYAFTERIPRFDLRQVDSIYLPEVVNRFFETSSLQKNLSKILLDIPTASIQIVFGLVLLSFYHPFFILFGILSLALLWMILYITGRKGLKSSIAESGHKYNVAGWMEEMARMVKSFKMNSAYGLHLRIADERTNHYLLARTNHFKVLLFQYKALIFFKVAITASMLIAGVLLLLDEQINIGQFVAAEIIIIMVLNAVEKTIMNIDSVYDVLTAVEKISNLTDMPVESSGSFKLSAGQGIGVEARNLSFEYETGKPVFSNISFHISNGEKAAITGNDGSGKSTLLRLMMGVYKNYSGALNINGIPLGNYTNESIRECIGIMFPPENIFNGTLWENITMGRKNVDSTYVQFLSEKIGLQSFIETQPAGYDTYLDPTGKRLPRNVIQKILVLRALCHKPRLILMEEPWQGIEEQYKSRIQDLLLGLNNATVIIATNDDAFSHRCDKIIRFS